jgi:hypothetical protein
MADCATKVPIDEAVILRRLRANRDVGFGATLATLDCRAVLSTSDRAHHGRFQLHHSSHPCSAGVGADEAAAAYGKRRHAASSWA